MEQEDEPVRTVPAIVQLSCPPGGSITKHLPGVVTLPPLVTSPLHTPPQHWLLFVQVSFTCRQNEVAIVHLPAASQPSEQHCPLVVQLLPATKHAPPLLVTQTEPVQRPLQH